MCNATSNHPRHHPVQTLIPANHPARTTGHGCGVSHETACDAFILGRRHARVCVCARGCRQRVLLKLESAGRRAQSSHTHEHSHMYTHTHTHTHTQVHLLCGRRAAGATGLELLSAALRRQVRIGHGIVSLPMPHMHTPTITQSDMLHMRLISHTRTHSHTHSAVIMPAVLIVLKRRAVPVSQVSGGTFRHVCVRACV